MIDQRRNNGPPAPPPARSEGFPRIVVVPESEFDGLVAEALAEALRRNAGNGRGVGTGLTHLTLAGGHTPRGGYRRLAELPGVPWEEVDVFFGDERAVPPDDADSNYRMALSSLLSRIPILPERIHRMQAEDPDRSAAAIRYEHLLPETLDILVLGVGPDGHTASLFPGGEPVREAVRRVLPAEGPASPRHRLTITPPVILSASEIFVLARGAEKATAVQRALEAPLDPAGCPAQLARSGTWILDEAAAGRLRATEGGRAP